MAIEASQTELFTEAAERRARVARVFAEYNAQHEGNFVLDGAEAAAGIVAEAAVAVTERVIALPRQAAHLGSTAVRSLGEAFSPASAR